jgi:hypothetical protein
LALATNNAFLATITFSCLILFEAVCDNGQKLPSAKLIGDWIDRKQIRAGEKYPYTIDTQGKC